jgi:hypothetical protein
MDLKWIFWIFFSARLDGVQYAFDTEFWTQEMKMGIQGFDPIIFYFNKMIQMLHTKYLSFSTFREDF